MPNRSLGQLVVQRKEYWSPMAAVAGRDRSNGSFGKLPQDPSYFVSVGKYPDRVLLHLTPAGDRPAADWGRMEGGHDELRK